MSGYTTRDVAELTGLTPRQVRDYIRRGLLNPRRGARGEYRLGFQDMVLLRTARGLRDARVPPGRAYSALLRLRDSLGEAGSLTALRIVADGANVVVQEAEALWNAESGQGHLNFAVKDLAGEVAELRQRDFSAASELDSDDWFNLGVDLEELDPARSADAYQVALDLDPENVDAHVNLGRLLQGDGQLDLARGHYQKALDRVPDHQLALYNLGTLFDEFDEFDAAVEYYRRADGVADAHYNLCRIFEMRGDQVTALRHLRRYRQLSGESGEE